MQCVALKHCQHPGDIVVRHIGEEPGIYSAYERRALQFRWIDIGGEIVIGMYVAIRPVMQVQPGNSPRTFEEDVMVTAHVEAFHLRQCRLLTAFGSV